MRKRVGSGIRVILLAAISVLGWGPPEASSDSLLFPFLTTEAGKFSFVTIANEGLNEFATLTGYHLTYGHKPVPIVQRRGCNHFDGNITSTPADMLTFEINGKVLDPSGTAVLFEGGLILPITSTGLVLPLAGQVAFLIVEPLGNLLAAEIAARIEVFGWAEVIDTAANMTLAYSTHNFGVNTSINPNFATSNVGNTWHRISWYPTALVTTTWHVLPLGLRSAMSPGGLRMTLRASNGVLAGAYDRDEQFWSGERIKTIRCFGIITRADLLQPGVLVATDNGGFLYAESFGAVTLPATDPDDPGGVYGGTQHLLHRSQSATAAAGLGTRTAINREPALDPSYLPTLDAGP